MSMIRSLACAALSAALLAAVPASAQTSGAMTGMDMKMMAPNASDSASTKGYKAAMMKMMEDMPMMKFTGDPDRDFMIHMRSHHQGAIDMAKVVLANGKDTEVKKLAQDIVAAQEKEIIVINSWLKAKGK